MSGARPDLLERFPWQIDRYLALGLTILTTGALSAVMLAYGLYAADAVTAPFAVAFGLLTAFPFTSVDRWLAGLATADTRRLLLRALPRIMLGLLLGLLVSVLISLQIFQHEIGPQVIVMRQQAATEFQNTISNSPLAKQIFLLRNEVDNYLRTVNTGGSAKLNPEHDAIVISLQAQLHKAEQQKNAAYVRFICELYGGGQNCPSGSGTAGYGPSAARYQAAYNAAAQQVIKLQQEINSRISSLTVSSVSAAQARVNEAKQNLPSAQALLARDQETLAVEQSAFALSNTGPPDLFTREEALSKLSAGNVTLNSSRFLLALFVAAMECLPTAVILLLRQGAYERALEASRLPDVPAANSVGDGFRRRALAELRDDGLPTVSLSSGTRSMDTDDEYDQAIRLIQDSRPTSPPGGTLAPRSSAT
jgi:hypothetical protein